MQQEERLLITDAVLPMRDRIGIFIEARESQDALARIHEAERVGVQHVWAQGTRTS